MDKNIEINTFIGSKGEIYLPKRIRDLLGLKPKDRITIRIKNGQIIITPIKDFESLLSEEPEVEVSLDEIHKCRQKLSERAE
ncbi:MAG: AbrB/MazE/SpoVT family DNA-binding domain-containing protein [Candidatus Asgardarchaeia archaeon]